LQYLNLILFFKKHKTEFLFFAAILTLLGIVFSLQTIYAESPWGTSGEIPTTQIIINVFVDRIVGAYLWLALSPFIILNAEKISSKKIPFVGVIVLHMLAGVFFSSLHIPIYTTYIFALHSSIPWMYKDVFDKFTDFTFVNYTIASFVRVNHVYRILYYCIIIAIHFAFDYFRKYSEKELRTTQLEMQLKDAQLNTLQQQLQPHFLFNTLNSISSLMYKSVPDADRMLTSLGDLLRISLERMNVQEVVLKDDIAFIERYLLIEKIRMGERLVIETHFGPETLDSLVPCMIIQPILENAIKHGISPYIAKGKIIISSWREGKKLFLQIDDSGKGFTGKIDSYFARGYGLRNTLSRLQVLYGSNFSFDCSKGKCGGLSVTLSIPFRMNKTE
jgi:two-component system, LytTR family, sensor kinase